MCIMTGPFFKAAEIKELPVLVKHINQKAGCAAAQEACDDPDSQGCRSQRRAVNDQLRIEQDGCHHESRKIILPHALLSE